QQYGEELPSDSNLKRMLILERGFGDGAASDLIRGYKETISLAALKSSGEGNGSDPRKDTGEGPSVSRAALPSRLSPPATNTEKPAGLRRYAFPLSESPDAELYLPSPMTEENYMLLKAMV